MLILCSRLTTSTVYPNHCSAAFYNLVTIMLSRLLFSQIDRILVGSPKVAQSGPVPVCKFPTCGQVCKARTRAWNMNHRGMSLSCPWLRHCAYAPTGGPWLRHRAYAPTCGPWLRHCAYAHAPGALNVPQPGVCVVLAPGAQNNARHMQGTECPAFVTVSWTSSWFANCGCWSISCLIAQCNSSAAILYWMSYWGAGEGGYPI